MRIWIGELSKDLKSLGFRSYNVSLETFTNKSRKETARANFCANVAKF
jgi:hypothetical protein